MSGFHCTLIVQIKSFIAKLYKCHLKGQDRIIQNNAFQMIHNYYIFEVVVKSITYLYFLEDQFVPYRISAKIPAINKDEDEITFSFD